MYVHREKKLWLSIYVDDLKMAGLETNIKPIWEELKLLMKLEPPKAMAKNIYLGCGQRDFTPDPIDIERIGAAFDNSNVKEGDSSARAAHPELRKKQKEVSNNIDEVFDAEKIGKVNLDQYDKSERNS